MTRTEKIRWLRDNGFTLLRHGSKHEIYVHPSGVRSIVPYGSKDQDSRGWRNELARLRRAGVM